MSNIQKSLTLFTLACAFLVLAGCGGSSGTDGDTTPLTVCSDFQQVLEDGSCGEPPPLPACPDGEIRVGKGACFEPDFPVPVYTPADDEVVIYFNKRDKQFDGYTLHLWQDCGNGWADGVPTTWPTGPGVVDADPDPIYGAYFVVKISETGTCGNFIIKNANASDQTNDLRIDITRSGLPYERMAFVIADPTSLRNSRDSAAPICIDDICEEYEKPALAINNVAAHWINRSTIVWHEDVSSVQLYSSATGEIAANTDGSVANGSLVAELSPTTLTSEQLTLTPHFNGYHAYSIDLPDEEIKTLLKQQLVLVGDADGGRIGTDVQKALLLDALYTDGDNNADEATLGVSYDGDGIAVSVWAPTAQKVELRLFSGNPPRLETTEEMTYDSTTGIWRYQGDNSLDRMFYRFRVTGYNAVAGEIVTLETTDPYSVSLSANGAHSQFVNLKDADVKPAGWDSHTVPTVAVPEAISIYEGHVRDFSIRDMDTPEEHRGKFLAFTHTGTSPVEHLQALADAGINHIHLLPTFDQSSIVENESEQVNLNSAVYELCEAVQPRNSAPVCDGTEAHDATLLSVFESYSPFEDSARVLAGAMAGYDGFNWGYDPQHFNAPDGSYATDPHGIPRIVEMRAMNMAFHNMGLRVVMDVVYPHTAAAGIEAPNSTFDKIVPGYYYRTNSVTGVPETSGSGAGPDTATERAMMGKFVTDSVVMWAEQYKVDGFRFDQSGLMPKSVLLNAWEAVKAVDPDNYFYGEAWTLNGGSGDERVAVLATQQNLAGTGIGTFNDRIRNPLRELDLVTEGGNENAIRAGLAGNLASFRLVTNSGNTIEASSVGAYNLDPQEAVNYVSKHDDETLWDWIHHPGALPENTSLENRVRIHNLTLSVPILSQGVPFFHMGTDLLRSKSLSRNSYNAGDWFNYIDFTKQTNNWNVGLPPELRDTLTDEDVLQAVIDTESTPAPSHIQLASDVFNEFLRISDGSPLFSLTTAEQVMDRVGFHNSGEGQRDNLIVMSIDDGVGTVSGSESEARADLDPAYDAVVVIINGADTEISQSVVTSAGFELHPVQASSIDPTARTASFTAAGGDELGGTFTVPAYTTAVFVKPQLGVQGEGLAATATSGYEPPVPYGDATVYVRGIVTWDPTDATAMTYEGDSIYSYTVELAAGTYGFKVADATWSTVNYGAGASDAVTLDTPLTLAHNGGNLSFTPATAGTYRFELDATDPAAPVLTAKDALDVWGAGAVYVRGDMNGWGADAASQFAYQGHGIYAVTLDVAAGQHSFKIASEDWSTVDYTAADVASATLASGDTVTLATIPGGHNTVLNAPAAASYKFTVDMSNPKSPTLTVEAE